MSWAKGSSTKEGHLLIQRLKKKMANKTLAHGLAKPGAKTDSQHKTYAANQEKQDAYRKFMEKRWGGKI